MECDNKYLTQPISDSNFSSIYDVATTIALFHIYHTHNPTLVCFPLGSSNANQKNMKTAFRMEDEGERERFFIV
jgi:hypothetical protein